jgi:hypothetical protein
MRFSVAGPGFVYLLLLQWWGGAVQSDFLMYLCDRLYYWKKKKGSLS